MKNSRCEHYSLWVIALGLFCFLAPLSLPGNFSDLNAAGLTTVRLPGNSEVDSDEVILGRIAEIEGSDLQLIRSLKNVVVGKAPQPGKSRRINAQFLKLRLRQSKIDLSSIQLVIPGEITITRSHVEIKKEEIELIISRFIHQNLSADREAVKIINIRVPDRVVLPKGQITYEVKLPRNTTELLGNFPLSVNFKVDEEFNKRIWTSATVEMLTDVVVTQKPVGRHKPITENDIKLVKMDLANLPSNAIADPELVLGRRSKRAINAGTILRTDLVELPPLVKRGDMVVIVFESGGMKITALGQVKRKGKLGERIPVMNFDSKKTLFAQVVDANTVKVKY